MYRGGGRGGGRGGDYGGRGGGDGVGGGPDIDMYASSGRGRGSSAYAASESEASSLAKEIQTSLFLTEQPAEVSVGSGSDIAVADLIMSGPAASPAEGTAYHTLLPASSEALVHASQPGWGKVRKMCNFLGQVAQNNLCLYDVAITPDTKSTRTNRAVMAELMEAYKHSFFGGKTPAYDGSKSIYTAGRLPFEAKSFVVKLSDRQSYEEEGKKNKGEKRYEDFKVTIRYVGGVDLTVLQQFLFGKMRDLPQETIRAVNRR